MLTSLRLVNFKNFADETLKLGPFTVIVGANASGKSNIRDAFRFVHGIGRGYTLAEIIGGKTGSGGETVWEQMRGAPVEIVRFEPVFPFSWSKFSMTLETDSEEGKVAYYLQVGLNQNSSEGFRVFEETLTVDERIFYTTDNTSDPTRLQVLFGDESLTPFRVNHTKPVLSQIFMYGHLVFPNGATIVPLPPVVARLPYAFGNTRFLEFSAGRLREPSVAGANTIGDYGQGLPAVLESICADPDRKQTLLSWLEELTPMDVASLEFPRDLSGRVNLYIVERNGRRVSAYSASDGTLRFLGILAALLNEEAGGIYFFEEIDNGIHPNRLWLLLELIERQTAKGEIQVITTTHNPALLDWIRDETFENTSVIYRDEYWSDSVIRPIADLYNLRELRKSRELGRLFTSGWLENAMKFSEGDYDTDHLDDDDEDDWGMDEE